MFSVYNVKRACQAQRRDSLLTKEIMDLFDMNNAVIKSKAVEGRSILVNRFFSRKRIWCVVIMSFGEEALKW